MKNTITLTCTICEATNDNIEGSPFYKEAGDITCFSCFNKEMGDNTNCDICETTGQYFNKADNERLCMECYLSKYGTKAE